MCKFEVSIIQHKCFFVFVVMSIFLIMGKSIIMKIDITTKTINFYVESSELQTCTLIPYIYICWSKIIVMNLQFIIILF